MKDFGVAMEAINNFYGLTTHKTTSLAGFDLSSSSKNLITNHKHLHGCMKHNILLKNFIFVNNVDQFNSAI